MRSPIAAPDRQESRCSRFPPSTRARRHNRASRHLTGGGMAASLLPPTQPFCFQARHQDRGLRAVLCCFNSPRVQLWLVREDITQGKQLPAASLQDKILELLGRPDYTPLDMAGLGRALGLQRSASQVLNQTLARMERAGQIARLKQGNRFGLPLQADLVPGRIRINRQGGGVLQPTDPRLPAIRVPSDATGTAMHGDRVLVRRDAAPRRVSGAEEPPAGRVVRVLERARTSLVGTLQAGRQFLYVIPDDPRIPQDIYVPPPTDVGRPAVPGDKVVVELREWTSRHTNPEGEIIEVLGSPDAEGVDMLSVIRQYQLSLHFPKKVLQEAKSIGWKSVTP